MMVVMCVLSLPAFLSPACSTIVSRAEWGARSPSAQTPLDPALSQAFVHHSAGTPCYTNADCEARVRAIQDLHMDSNGV